MEGHFFMSNGLKGRIQGELETLSENIVFIHDNENETFTSGYRSFFASPGILSVEGTLTSEVPHWLFERLGDIVTVNITLRSTTIMRDIKLINISVDHDNESWTITGEIFNSRDEK
tara:strand:+ start:482 stop:829 length:348 start_codon:yes stop_codon:yes gene_type:complete